jgi:hypothetical protein
MLTCGLLFLINTWFAVYKKQKHNFLQDVDMNIIINSDYY